MGTRFKNPIDLPAEMREPEVEQLKNCQPEEQSAAVEKVVVQEDATETIQFRGEDWRIFWPKHSRNRTYDRHSNPKVARHSLNFLLKLLEPMSDRIWPEFTGEVTLRAFPLKSCFILKVSKEDRNICVTTYGDCASFNPRYGDTVISLAENGNVSAMRWQKLNGNTTPNQDKRLLGCVAYQNK